MSYSSWISAAERDSGRSDAVNQIVAGTKVTSAVSRPPSSSTVDSTPIGPSLRAMIFDSMADHTK